MTTLQTLTEHCVFKSAHIAASKKLTEKVGFRGLNIKLYSMVRKIVSDQFKVKREK